MYHNNSIVKKDFDITISGRSVRVRKITAPDQPHGENHPVLVFLHEGLGCIDMWRDFPEELVMATGCDALLYDRFGHGYSARLNHVRTVRYLEDEALLILPEVLDICSVDNSILIGHSDGGSIALIFSSEHPVKVKDLITEAAHVFVEEITIKGIEKTVHLYNSSNLKKKLTRYHGEKTEALFNAWANIWLSDDFLSWNIESYLARVICPSLIIQGRNDEYGTIRQVNAITSLLSGNTEPYIVPGCGHSPHSQSKEMVLEKMIQFINRAINSEI